MTRFDRARRRLTPRARVAEVAVAGGYYDQAHLSREFRALAGCSPARWPAEEFTSVQDRPAPDGQNRSHD